MNIYIKYNASRKEYTKVGENICVSSCVDLSLEEYCCVRQEYCLSYHQQSNCSNCANMVKAAKQILSNGFYPLSHVFHSCFPGVTYTSATAKRKLLQMPLIAITLGHPTSGKSEVYLMEAVDGLNYSKLIEFIESNTSKGAAPINLTKSQVKELLSFAQSDRERETLRYTVCRASGLTSSAARRQYGWERMAERSANVEKCLEDAQSIRENIEYLCTTQERAVLISFGIDPDSSHSGSEDDVDEMDESVSEERRVSSIESIPSELELNAVLRESQYNWFQLVDYVTENGKCEEDEEDAFVINWKSASQT